MYLCCSMKSLKKNCRGRKRISNGGQKGVSENSITPISIVGERAWTEEEFGSN